MVAESPQPLPLLKASQVAEMLSVDQRTVYRWAEEGVLPAVRLGGKVVRFRPEAIRRLIELGGSM